MDPSENTPGENLETAPLLANTQNRPQYSTANDEAAEPISTLHEPSRKKSRLCFFLFGFLLFIFLISALLVAVVPRIAQHFLDDGAVQVLFEKAEITDVDPTDEAVTSVGIHVTGGVKLNEKLATVASWMSRNVLGQAFIVPSDLVIFNGDEPNALGVIGLPNLPLDLTQQESRFEFDTRFLIQNESALAGFCRDAVQKEYVNWKIRGPVGVKPGWLPLTVRMNLDKEVVLQGMDGLRNVQMENISFPGEHPRGGIVLQAVAMIYNPSNALSFTLGDIDFAIFLPVEKGESINNDEEVMIAVVRANDAKLLSQQTNRLILTGRTVVGDARQWSTVNDIYTQLLQHQALDQFLSRYLKGQPSLVRVRGSSFGPEDDISDSSTPDWLRTALQSVTLFVRFPGSPTTDFIRSLSIEDVSIEFAPDIGVLISGTAISTLRTPEMMQFPINVTQIHPLVYIYLNSSSPKPFAELAPTESSPARTIPDEGTDGQLIVSSKLHKAPFIVLPGMEDDFEKFLNETFYGVERKATIRGKVDAVIESALGNNTVRDLEFEGEISSKGMQGLAHPPPNIISIAITHGAPDAIALMTSFTIFNPSDVTVSLGTANFDLVYDGEVIGNASIVNFKVGMGWNEITSLGYFNPGVVRNRHHNVTKVDAEDLTIQDVHDGGEYSGKPDNREEQDGKAWIKGLEFLSKYVSGEETTLTVHGNRPDSSSNRYLLPLLQKFTFITNPPLLNDSMLVNSTMYIFSSTIILYLHNPLPNTTITILALNSTAKYKGHIVGNLEVDFEIDDKWGGPLVLPASNATQKMGDKGEDEDDGPIDGAIATPKLPFLYNVTSIGFETIKRALGGSIEVNVTSRCRLMVGEMRLEELIYVRKEVVARIRKGY